MAIIRTIQAVRPTPHSTASATVMQIAASWVQRVTSTVFIVAGAEYRMGDNINLYRFLKITLVMKANEQVNPPTTLPHSMAVWQMISTY